MKMAAPFTAESPAVARAVGALCLAVAAVVVVLGSALPAHAADPAPHSFVEYQGKRIPTTKAYQDFRQYKNDPDNLSPADAKAAAELVRRASFGPRFATSKELFPALMELSFPGYGFNFVNQLKAKLDPELELVTVELPGNAAHRVIVLQAQSGDGLLVIDDFVAPARPEILRVRRGPDGTLHLHQRFDQPPILIRPRPVGR